MQDSSTKRSGVELTSVAFPQYDIGKGTYSIPGAFNVVDWRQGTTLRIGRYCSIAHSVKIFLGGEHRTDWVTTYPFPHLWQEASRITGHPSSRGDVVIGNDVWLGYNATILSGVTIGDGAVIGANATVASDIPPYAIAAGNPARVIKKRFDEQTISRLEKLSWWHWPDDKIARMLHLMLSTDINAFLNAAEQQAEH